MVWTPDDIPDQRGRVIVVTGANGGLGLATARELARRGARVLLAARDQARAVEARRLIEDEIPGAALELHELDLASLDAVRSCAERIVEAHPRLDVLVNNAGVMAVPEGMTVDGFETQLGVNHLGHFVLTRRLLPALARAAAARVVTVTSFGRYVGRRVDPDDPHLRHGYGPWRAYNRSKLANLFFAVELQRRLEQAGSAVASLAADPGLAYTDLQARSVRATGGGLSHRFWHAAARSVGVSPSRGARPVLRAATDPGARAGWVYGPRWGTFGAPVRGPLLLGRPLDRKAAETLWRVSEQETMERFDVAVVLGGG